MNVSSKVTICNTNAKALYTFTLLHLRQDCLYRNLCAAVGKGGNTFVRAKMSVRYEDADKTKSKHNEEERKTMSVETRRRGR